MNSAQLSKALSVTEHRINTIAKHLFKSVKDDYSSAEQSSIAGVVELMKAEGIRSVIEAVRLYNEGSTPRPHDQVRAQQFQAGTEQTQMGVNRMQVFLDQTSDAASDRLAVALEEATLVKTMQKFGTASSDRLDNIYGAFETAFLAPMEENGGFLLPSSNANSQALLIGSASEPQPD